MESLLEHRRAERRYLVEFGLIVSRQVTKAEQSETKERYVLERQWSARSKGRGKMKVEKMRFTGWRRRTLCQWPQRSSSIQLHEIDAENR
jgi:hypothetical protein